MHILTYGIIIANKFIKKKKTVTIIFGFLKVRNGKHLLLTKKVRGEKINMQAIKRTFSNRTYMSQSAEILPCPSIPNPRHICTYIWSIF